MTTCRGRLSIQAAHVLWLRVLIPLSLALLAAVNVSAQDAAENSSSSLRKESNGFWLYRDGEKSPAFTGLVYQPTSPGRHIRDYEGRLFELYSPLLDESEGGHGHGRRLAALGVSAIRIFQVPDQFDQDADDVRQVFRWLHRECGIKVLIGLWAGLYSEHDPSTAAGRLQIFAGIDRTITLYAREPWVLGWQIGNENNYYVVGGKLRDGLLELNEREYFSFVDTIAAMIKGRLGRLGVEQFVSLGNGDLTETEARLIGDLKNIDAVGLNVYRSPGSLAQVVETAAAHIDRPIYLAELGCPASSPGEEVLQADYLKSALAQVYYHASGRCGHGNVIGAFVHEATDELWKPEERGVEEDAHYGVFGKHAEKELRTAILHIRGIWKDMPADDDPSSLLTSSWAFASKRDYGIALEYAARVVAIYEERASSRGSAGAPWATDAVGTAHLITGKCHYELYKTLEGMGDERQARAHLRLCRESFDRVATFYPTATFIDADGRQHPISSAIRRLFPDLVEPYVDTSLRSCLTVAGVSVAFLLASAYLLARSRRSSGARRSKLESARRRREIHRAFRVSYLALFVMEIVIAYVLLFWWVHPVRIEFYTVDTALFILLTIIGVVESVFYLFVWFSIWTVRHPPEPGRVDKLKAAMVTTHVKGEPTEVLEKTVEAMSSVAYGHRTFVLDESNRQEVRDVCRRHGAHHFSREGVPEYNTTSGRNQRRTKGGNLNAWLDEFGADFDVVTFLDPDHIPQPDYLDRVLGYFSDDRVAFVQAPPAYHNQADGWVSRGAAEQTYLFYGAIQLGLQALGACTVNGSHCTLRISALIAIGGYAVHDADDVLTSLRLHASGYRGVYVPETLATGLAPCTLSEFLKQQLRWSASMFNLLLFHYWRYLKSMSMGQIACYLSLPTFYCLGLCFCLLLLLPVVSVALNRPPVNADLLPFAARFLPLIALRYLTLGILCQRLLPTGFGQSRGLWLRAGLLWILTWPQYVIALGKAALNGPRVRDRVVSAKKATADPTAWTLLWFPGLMASACLSALIYSYALSEYTWPAEGMRLFLVLGLVCSSLILALVSKEAANSK